MKTLQQKIAYEVWGTNPYNFNAEAKAGTPYQTNEDTLSDIEYVAIGHFKGVVIAELEIIEAHYKQYNDHIELLTVQECISKIKSL